jgi:hypothetical protein
MWETPRVFEEAQRRVAQNEVLFRDTNEAIARGQWPGEPNKIVRFRCECSQLDCGEAVELSLARYERVRAFPRRFLLAPGHDRPEIETVVSRTDGCVIVEKQDAAGELAAATDPRA